MTDAQRLGLIMLAWVSHSKQPSYHDMDDEQLYHERSRLKRETAMLSEFVVDCRKALAEAEREYRYHDDQLDWVEGIIEVRNLNRRDQTCRKKN